MIRIWLTLIVVCACLNLSVAYAQTLDLGATAAPETSLPDPLTPEAVRELVSRLSDEEVRALLLRRLDAEASDSGATEVPGLGAFLGNTLADAGRSIAREIAILPSMGDSFTKAWTGFRDGRSNGEAVWVMARIVLAMFIGLAAMMGVQRLLAPWRTRLETARPAGFGSVAAWYAKRLALSLAGIATFAVVAVGLARLMLDTASDVSLATRTITLIAGMGMVAGSIERLVSAVDRPDLRPLSVDDGWARFVSNCFLIGICIWVFDRVGLSFFRQYGVGPDETRFGFWMTFILYAFTITTVIYGRESFRQAIVGRDGLMGPLGLRIASVWAFVAAILLACNWLLIDTLARAGRFDLISGQQNVTLTIIMAAAVIDTALRAFVVANTRDMEGEGPIAERAHRALQRAWVRIGRVILIAAFLILISEMWEVDLIDAAGGAVGQQVAARLLNFLMAIFLGYLIWEVMSLYINRMLARELTEAGIDLESDEPGGGDGGGAGLSRLATVLPILRMVGSFVIWVVTALVALSELGVDTTPLLAGSAIVGLAIGFGAQALVKDVVSGIFFLIDDAFRMGEYIMIGETKGTVEKIALRSLQLRHHLGAVHTVPYGEIPQVTNHSRDWVMMKLKFTFPFETDPQIIKKIFKKIGAEMQEAYYADDLIQTWKSQGVIDVDDIGVVIRGKFMCKPGAQWVIRKDVYTRVQKAIEAAGIAFARKEVRVQFPAGDGPRDMTEDEKTRVAAAAAEASSGPMPEGQR